MSAQEDWLERRKRLVQCKIHGLTYDPKMTSGCAKCRKEEDKRTASSPQYLVFLLAILGLAVILYRIFGLADPEQAEELATDPAPFSVEESRKIVSLDSSSYRNEVSNLEKALFDSPGVDPDNLGFSVASATRNLTEAVRRQDSESGQNAILELEQLTQRAEQDSFDLEGLEDYRETWLRVRSRHFSPASWFLAAPKASDRTSLSVFLNLANELQGLLDEGSAEARAAAGDEANTDRWNRFVEDWRPRLTTIRRQMPSKPDTGAQSEVLLATQNLESTFQQALSLNLSSPGEGAAQELERLSIQLDSVRRTLGQILGS